MHCKSRQAPELKVVNNMWDSKEVPLCIQKNYKLMIRHACGGLRPSKAHVPWLGCIVLYCMLIRCILIMLHVYLMYIV